MTKPTNRQIGKLFVCHSCNNPACVNPEHLYAGTPKQNTQDMIQSGNHRNQRKNKCPKGHNYDEANTSYKKMAQEFAGDVKPLRIENIGKKWAQLFVLKSVLLITMTAMGHTMKVKIDQSSIYDGDTVKKVAIPLGLNIYAVETIRLANIDAPELKKAGGKEAREALIKLIGECKDLQIEAVGRGSFGRVLSILYCGKTNINKVMLDKGFAVPYRKGH